jgi:branched-chain amino acid transport system ATP-binding protein
MLLELDKVQSGYGRAIVLRDVSLHVDAGEIVSVLGVNGAGKTTTLRTVSGLLPTRSGAIRFNGQKTGGLSVEERARAGLGHVPEGRGVLGTLSVQENLGLSRAMRRTKRSSFDGDVKEILDLFPILGHKMKERASSLSGGQQQMLALARALLGRPKLLMIDELSFGLAPIVVSELFGLIRGLRNDGTTFLLVEQNAGVLGLSDRTYVLNGGRVVLEGESNKIATDGTLVRSYFGMSTAAK